MSVLYCISQKLSDSGNILKLLRTSECPLLTSCNSAMISLVSYKVRNFSMKWKTVSVLDKGSAPWNLHKLLSTSLCKILRYFSLAFYDYAKQFPQPLNRQYPQFTSIYCALSASDGNIGQVFWVKRDGRLSLIISVYRRDELFTG